MNDDGQPQATKALVVLAVGLAGRWRLPLCYCLTDGTNSQLQQSILLTVISELWQSGCYAVSITLDGLAANQKTLENLGCSLDPDNIVSVFPHPECAGSSVAAVFDACHMLKLARNCLNEYQILVAPGEGHIKWEYLNLLQKKQLAEGLNLANKLTLSHIQYKKQKMKVRLAAQIISSSCAAALEYLRKSGYVEFSETSPTENFFTQNG